ncbi:von Willebrand factor A domain-containing protein 7-like [Esox lucius]|uniref:von Willebrand factor A domain-containing protein 7-like n=1 Tax=Esox lucius TaxID=8010 RepID=A0A3P8ZK12_ESOLU|nr:von Willebrand factor A domain-containing protein 7-like [Esox lucius]XP_010903896.2 von Willebrand factor A domain-containing protein 7-like [Esox lucius]
MLTTQSGLAVVCLVLLWTEAQGFKVLWAGRSNTHQNITTAAILQTTAQACKGLASVEGRDFTLPPGPLTAETLALACSSSGSVRTFQSAISQINKRNARVDIRHVFNAEYHFDNEMFVVGRKLITDGMNSVKSSTKQGNFETARQTLGGILHTLQDFYSHSNWIELNNQVPHFDLIRADVPDIGPVADKDTPTCQNCVGADCRNNILENIIRDKKLTSGYFGLVPFFSKKPKGKCSHGGGFDRTSSQEPVGGINKDSLDSSHGYLHIQAAEVAGAATRELLQDIRGAAGDRDFLRMMGISTNGSSVLCFVIDTTGSMSDDIDAVRKVTSFIIDSKKGTAVQPSAYILVPFNDPEFGPLMRTTDPEKFKAQINALTAAGGGDFPEMCLSGLQLALTGAPPSSEIFVFTDAPPKDLDLLGTVTALIERTKSVVTFMLTGSLGFRRRRSSVQGQNSRMAASDSQVYLDLAQTSGGQAIQTTKTDLPRATSIIVDSSSSSLVTILQAVRNPGRADNFSFTVDDSVRNLTAYFTGRSLSFTITSPSGLSQSSVEVNGSLGTIQTVGNFYTLRMDSQVGLWEISVSSTVSYTLKVIGQSTIDFLFDFVEVALEPHPSYAVLQSRPQAGGNGTLLVSVTGSDSVRLTEVALVEASGSGEVNGTVESVGSRDYLVTVNTIPAGEFVVRLKGESTSTATRAAQNIFQRQSSTRLRTSTIVVTALAEGFLEPGTPFSIPFTVTTNDTAGSLTIRASNDRGFSSSFPSTLALVTGGANGTVNLTAPPNTPSGTDVTLTIEAESPGATNTNYALLRLSVVSKVTDVNRPVCEEISVKANCSEDCSLSTWELSANLTDGNGTGIERVTLRRATEPSTPPP